MQSFVREIGISWIITRQYVCTCVIGVRERKRERKRVVTYLFCVFERILPFEWVSCWIVLHSFRVGFHKMRFCPCNTTNTAIVCQCIHKLNEWDHVKYSLEMKLIDYRAIAIYRRANTLFLLCWFFIRLLIRFPHSFIHSFYIRRICHHPTTIIHCIFVILFLNLNFEFKFEFEWKLSEIVTESHTVYAH